MKPITRAALFAVCLLATAVASHAGTITIVNTDGPGEGLNDLSSATPVGGNNGTTLGQQRMIVLQAAAAVWGSILPDGIEIKVDAHFDPISGCNATSGVLASTAVTTFYKDLTGLPIAGTFYPQALANKLTGADQNNLIDDMDLTVNSDVDNATCLGPSNWYYGLDGNEGTNQELLPVLIHEMGHGLGFTAQVNPNGTFSPSGSPSIFSRFILDNVTGLHWSDGAMSQSQRQAAFISTGNEVWDGPALNAQVATMMQHQPVVSVSQPAGIAGEYFAGTAAFGKDVTYFPVTAQVVLVNDPVSPTSDGCETPFVNAAAIAGKIAFIDRGLCTFTAKALNAQGAGAVGLIIANNAAGSAPDLGGSDPSITIPVLSVSQADGNTIRNQLGNNVVATLGLSATTVAGVDPNGRLRLYAPNPAQSGSSISHWDTAALPNLLMEPNNSASLRAQVDMTRYAFRDLGWFTGSTITGVGNGPGALPRLMSSPNPFDGATTVSFGLERAGPVELAVFGVDGGRVRRLIGWSLEAGPHSVAWDGKDDSGRAVPAGMYLFRLEASGRTWTGRTVRLP